MIEIINFQNKRFNPQTNQQSVSLYQSLLSHMQVSLMLDSSLYITGVFVLKGSSAGYHNNRQPIMIQRQELLHFRRLICCQHLQYSCCTYWFHTQLYGDGFKARHLLLLLSVTSKISTSVKTIQTQVRWWARSVRWAKLGLNKGGEKFALPTVSVFCCSVISQPVTVQGASMQVHCRSLHLCCPDFYIHI